jgi:hypothetical protein
VQSFLVKLGPTNLMLLLRRALRHPQVLHVPRPRRLLEDPQRSHCEIMRDRRARETWLLCRDGRRRLSHRRARRCSSRRRFTWWPSGRTRCPPAAPASIVAAQPAGQTPEPPQLPMGSGGCLPVAHNASCNGMLIYARMKMLYTKFSTRFDTRYVQLYTSIDSTKCSIRSML